MFPPPHKVPSGPFLLTPCLPPTEATIGFLHLFIFPSQSILLHLEDVRWNQSTSHCVRLLPLSVTALSLAHVTARRRSSFLPTAEQASGVRMPQFVSPLSCWWIAGCSQALASRNKTAGASAHETWHGHTYSFLLDQ